MIKQCKGISLIEIMIAFFLLSLTLLGFEALEIQSLQRARSLLYYHQATQQLENMVELLQLAHTPLDLEQAIATWKKQNAIVLPRGRGQVVASPPEYRITIFWGNDPATECLTHQKTPRGGCLSCTINL
jgi:Tfp pilus assembly protein PilV